MCWCVLNGGGPAYLVKELLAGCTVEDSELQLGVHGGNANIYLSETQRDAAGGRFPVRAASCAIETQDNRCRYTAALLHCNGFVIQTNIDLPTLTNAFFFFFHR